MKIFRVKFQASNLSVYVHVKNKTEIKAAILQRLGPMFADSILQWDEISEQGVFCIQKGNV